MSDLLFFTVPVFKVWLRPSGRSPKCNSIEQWFLTFLTVPHVVVTPQTQNYLCCCFITVIFATIQNHNVNICVYWWSSVTLWKGHIIPKEVVTHKLRTAAIEPGNFSWFPSWCFWLLRRWCSPNVLVGPYSVPIHPCTTLREPVWDFL